MKIYARVAQLLNAMENCRKRGNHDWLDKHEETLFKIMNTAPSGSGIDSGTVLEKGDCKENKLVFTFGYHHMNDGGYYDGWTDHMLTVTPDLMFGIKLKIAGKDRNQIKEYLHQVYEEWLNEETRE